MITGEQIRHARKLLAWDRETLARRAKVRCSAIERAETVPGEPPITIYQATLIRNALQQGGVKFTDCDNPASLGAKAVLTLLTIWTTSRSGMWGALILPRRKVELYRNLAILGGLLFYFVSGPGAWSLGDGTSRRA